MPEKEDTPCPYDIMEDNIMSERRILVRKRLFLFAICLITAIGFYNVTLHPPAAGIPVSIAAKNGPRILLMPLDSRPPCRQFVIDAGRIAGIEIITPPSKLMDYYSQPGNTKALQDWIMANINGCDAAILSIDQLLHGGLLAAREAKKSPADVAALLTFFSRLHQCHPEVPLYAFNILPRLTPPDSIDSWPERKRLMRYSRLADRTALAASSPNPDDLAALNQLKKEIQPENLRQYEELFRQNTQLNKQLARLAKKGIFTRLVIGQDDGEKYGIPNMEKRAIQTYLTAENITDKQVFITHGADEIALTLLAAIDVQKNGRSPRIFLAYNDPATPEYIMPYMAGSIAATAQEKIQLLHGIQTETPETADFILYLSGGNTATLSCRRENAANIKNFIRQGYSLALVDLSEHFAADETLLPLLIKNQTPLHSLIAYAGWNTASNAIGTAMSQAVLFTNGKQTAANHDDWLRLYAANLTFLDNRYLEDYFYLKDSIDGINSSLRKAGYTNVSDLDLEHNYQWANYMLQTAMNRRLSRLKQTAAFRAPVVLSSPDGPTKLYVREISCDTSYPWPRTFEIYLHSTLWLNEIK